MITREFLTAGWAVFTVSNPQGERYTFRAIKVGTHLQGGGKFILFLLTGPDNKANYDNLMMFTEDLEPRVHPYQPAFLRDSKPEKVALWFLKKIRGNRILPPGYTIQHARHCGRCGRLLTVPESIESGLGPKCAKLARG